MTDARDGQSRTIRQFHFTDWPEQGVPKSGEGFIDFIGQVGQIVLRLLMNTIFFPWHLMHHHISLRYTRPKSSSARRGPSPSTAGQLGLGSPRKIELDKNWLEIRQTPYL